MTVISQAPYKRDKLSRLRLAIILTALGMAIEFAGGLLSNSLALISDAWHMLTHLFALGMSYFGILLAMQPVTKKRTYGFYRAEVLVAFINGLVLIFISFYIVYDAILRFIHPQQIKIWEMLLVALIGLAINGVSIFLLTKINSADLNIRSAILHELGDMASSVAVVSGGIFIFYSKNYLVDPLLALLISILIIIWAVKLLKESADILLEAAPKHLDLDNLVNALKEGVAGIDEVHHVHAWTIAPAMYALTAHVVIEDCQISKTNAILKQINDLLKERFSVGHTNIQFECLIRKE